MITGCRCAGRKGTSGLAAKPLRACTCPFTWPPRRQHPHFLWEAIITPPSTWPLLLSQPFIKQSDVPKWLKKFLVLCMSYVFRCRTSVYLGGNSEREPLRSLDFGCIGDSHTCLVLLTAGKLTHLDPNGVIRVCPGCQI